MINKERALEEEHMKKISELKTQVMDIKAGFDNRVKEFKQ